MADWRKFIGKKEEHVLPYFGGERVRTKDREVRLSEKPDKPGWYRFELEGRTAKPVGPADPDVTGLPKVRGHLVGDVIFAAGALPEYVSLLPEEEPALFSSCTCFRWHDDELVFGEIDFDSEAEEIARLAFEERGGLDESKGVPASVRAAFAWATVRRASQEEKIPCTAREAWPHASDIASGGHAAAEALLDRLEELRHGRRIVVAGQTIRLKQMIERATDAAATVHNAGERAHAAIEAAGGRINAVRRLGGQQIEVQFRFGGERFVSVVDAITLGVIDAGICLVDHGDGHRGDADLTLDSLPAAIREAMDLGVLVITRR